MKKIIKNNMPLIISFTILFAFTTFLGIKVVINDRENERISIEIKEKCIEYLKTHKDNETCLNVINEKTYKRDTLTTFKLITSDSDYRMIYYFLVPFLVISSSLYTASKRFNSNEIKNYLTRESYNKYIRKVFSSSYKSILIWPLITIYIFIFSYAISGTFEVSSIEFSTFSSYILRHPYWFMISYLINTVLMSAFYINIGLLLVPENRNYLVTVIETIMLYYGLALTNTFFVIGFLLRKYENAERYLDFLDMYNYYQRELIPFNLLCLIIFLISSLILYIKYKNKEKIITKLERN